MTLMTSAVDRQENSSSFWDKAVVYQIYPLTFNEDKQRSPQRGIGSIRGITEKLDYISHDLGADAIWLSPFYLSPQKDGGYDIADASAINPELGTMEDMDDLIAACHERGMKVMIDYIPNHTSDQHAWFQESLSSRDNGKSDWYVWANPVLDEAGNRTPPNNWASVFSLPQIKRRQAGELGDLSVDEITPPISAWTWSETRGQYYLHSFADFQPDLNWHNPDVQAAMLDVMRFWLNKGVDGFRIDAVNYVGKNICWNDDGSFKSGPNEERNTAYVEGKDNPYDQFLRYNSCGYPDTFYSYIKLMISVLHEDAYADRDTRIIFEAYMNDDDLQKINQLDPAKASAFNFSQIDRPWDYIRKLHSDSYFRHLPTGAIGNFVNGNHDKSRLATRLGEKAARAAAMYGLLMPGITFIYNGEELNLEDFDAIPIDRERDPNGMRDAERAPIPWVRDGLNAGFSYSDESKLYLPVDPKSRDKAVDVQKADPNSTLNYYKRLIKLKKQLDGGYIPLTAENESDEYNTAVQGYSRIKDGKVVSVLINFTDERNSVRLPSAARGMAQVVLSMIAHEPGSQLDMRSSIVLQPSEALIVEPES